MFCPQCGSTQSDELKFCKSCGANLQALRKVMASRDESDEKFDWSKTWVTEMFMSGEEAVRRKAEIDRMQGKNAETRRLAEIKGGVISASAGIALMIFLFALMEGIIMGGRVSDAAAAILSRLWLVGVIPLFVGAALIINGMFISTKGVKGSVHETDAETGALASSEERILGPAETRGLASEVPFSVTDDTTKHLKDPIERH